ncbi:MAG: energy transducer TonB [Candidatus Rokuibacteriota bacterium]|nr:MAG: energy transducer TonB [Candidatus Rokubacteria bacterium]
MLTIFLVLLLLGIAADAPGAQPGDVIQLSPIEIKAPALPTSQPFVPAAYRETPLPSYPTAAREQGLEGVVVLGVLVGVNGRAVEIAVRTSSGARTLDDAAVEAVTRWRFSPAREGRKAVESWVEVPLKFALRGK